MDKDNHPIFTGKITVSHHAIEEAIKDFRVNRKLAEEWIRNKLRNARFIANVIAEDGNASRLFGFERIAFALAQGENHVITVYPRHRATPSLREKIERAVFRELRKVERLEAMTERKNRLQKAELNVERAQLLLKMERGRNERTRVACQARIDEIDKVFAQLDEKIAKIRNEKRTIAASVIAYV